MSEASSPALEVDAFLRSLERRTAALSEDDARELAGAIAERHLAVLGEDEGGTRAMVATLRGPGGPVTRAQLEAWVRELQALGEVIDPDRIDAAEKRRAVSVLTLALACGTEGAPGSAVFAVARAALAVRALCWPAKHDDEGQRDAERKTLATRWAWDAVQDEARWLAAQLEVDGAEPKPRPVRMNSLPTAAPARAERFSEARPPRAITLPLMGRAVRFVGEDAGFRAEIDGQRCRIRARLRFLEVSTAGTLGDDPPWQESGVVDLTRLIAALNAGAVHREEAGRTVVELHQAGAHFRQNEWTTVVITLAADAVVEIETTQASQDESYY